MDDATTVLLFWIRAARWASNMCVACWTSSSRICFCMSTPLVGAFAKHQRFIEWKGRVFWFHGVFNEFYEILFIDFHHENYDNCKKTGLSFKSWKLHSHHRYKNVGNAGTSHTLRQFSFASKTNWIYITSNHRRSFITVFELWLTRC